MVTGTILITISIAAFAGGVTIGTLQQKNQQLLDELKKQKEEKKPRILRNINFWF